MAMSSTALSYLANTSLILFELDRTLTEVSEAEVAAAQRALVSARRVFISGAGRSGLAVKMAAMRLMHLGLTVHVAGEVTAPPIEADDLLVVASGSGTTPGAVHGAQVAINAGARVLALTTAPESSLGTLAHLVIVIPAAAKQDHGRTISEQYAGALFEQSVLLLMDAMFQTMWHERGESAEQMWKRHANLE
jgi:6-phospho-3-hexuloisomerase